MHQVAFLGGRGLAVLYGCMQTYVKKMTGKSQMGRGLSSLGWVVRVWSQSDDFPLQTVMFLSTNHNPGNWSQTWVPPTVCNNTLIVFIVLKI